MADQLTTIETLAGSSGAGPALEVAQTPNALAVAGGTLYVSDGLWSVIRAIDLATGDETVVASGLADPVDVAAGPGGDLFVVDYTNHRIVRRARGGSTSVVTGTGEAGFGGDGGPATAAQLDTPNGVAVDRDGNVFVADTNNQRVRRVAPDGTIATVAGSGERGYAGDGGPATQAAMSAPSGVHVGADGVLFIADTDNHCIRAVDASGTIRTVAGTGTRGFSGDGGPATSAQLDTPFGVYADAAGAVYVPDFKNERIRRVGPTGTITTVAGTGTAGFSGDGGPASAAQLRSATDVVEDDHGNVYVADLGNRRVRRIAPDGTIATIAGSGSAGFSGDGGPATGAQLLFPSGVCTDGDGVLVADSRNHRVRRVDRAGTIVTVAGTGRGGFAGDGAAATQAQLNRPAGLCPAAAGGVYVADRANHRIRRIAADGTIATVAGTGTPGDAPDGVAGDAAPLNAPAAVAAGPAGELWIADTLNHRVRRLDPAGTLNHAAGVGTPGFCGDGGIGAHAHLNTPTGLAAGRDGELYVADTANHRIRRLAPDGTITTFAGTGERGFGGDGGPAAAARLDTPSGLALDRDGALHVADGGNRRVRRIDPDGTITTVAGDGTPGLGGDGGPPAEAQLRLTASGELAGLAIGPGGALHVADTENHRVRRARAAHAPPDKDVTAGAAPDAAGEPVVVASAGGTRVVYRGRDGHVHVLAQ